MTPAELQQYKNTPEFKQIFLFWSNEIRNKLGLLGFCNSATGSDGREIRSVGLDQLDIDGVPTFGLGAPNGPEMLVVLLQQQAGLDARMQESGHIRVYNPTLQQTKNLNHLLEAMVRESDPTRGNPGLYTALAALEQALEGKGKHEVAEAIKAIVAATLKAQRARGA